jgi:(R,R)-butanediol dehydrogenase/meso-butanediol dehydrogenase/diacetyl reductase
VYAARFHARGDLRVEEVGPLGSPAPGWIRIGVEACGICATDTHELAAGPFIVPAEPHPVSGRSAPLTLGHEPVGVVLETGAGVDLEVGTRVAVETNVVCHHCFWCRRGDFQLCPELVMLGLTTDGGLAEEMVAPAYMCFPCGAAAPTVAALAEPLSVAVRAVRRAGVGPGSTLGIVGAGTIGLLLLQVAHGAGAERIVVVEPHEGRRGRALAMGADLAVPPADAPASAVDLTEGVGLDMTIESAGHPDAALLAIRLARRGGRTILLGVSTEELRIPLFELLMDEREIATSLSHAYDTDFAAAVDLLVRGEVDVGPIVTDRVGLDAAPEAFRMLLEEPDEHLRVLVLPRCPEPAVSRRTRCPAGPGRPAGSGRSRPSPAPRRDPGTTAPAVPW